jgi:hypothetical protein
MLNIFAQEANHTAEKATTAWLSAQWSMLSLLSISTIMSRYCLNILQCTLLDPIIFRRDFRYSHLPSEIPRWRQYETCYTAWYAIVRLDDTRKGEFEYGFPAQQVVVTSWSIRKSRYDISCSDHIVRYATLSS